MTNVNGVHNAAAVSAVAPVAPATEAAAAAASAPTTDVIEISTLAQLAAKVHELPDVRTELVERVKAEIAAGTYDTPERMDIALDRLMDELMG